MKKDLLFRTMHVGCLAWVIALQGCSGGADIQPSVTPVSPEASALDRFTGDGTWPGLDWLGQFRDQQLTALINEALLKNPDMHMAQARLRMALAKAEELDSARGFSGNVIGTISRMRTPLASESFDANVAGTNVPVDVSLNPWQTPTALLMGAKYQFDLWGKDAALQRALANNQQAAVVDTKQAELILTTTLAKLYCQFDYYLALGDLLKEQVDVFNKIDQILQARVKQGLDNGYDSGDLQIKRNAVVTQQLLNEQDITLTQLQLGLLSGGGADRGFLLQRPQLASLNETALPQQLSINLLGRRPDIVAARWRIEAMSEKANATRASFYPDVNLNALAGLATLDVSSFLSNEALIASVGPAISLPLFDRGRIRARLRNDVAELDIAVAQYNKTVNEAFVDVIRQLTSINKTDSLIDEQQQAATTASRIGQIVEKRHDRGIISEQTRLQTRLSTLGERQRLLALRAQRLALQVDMIRALGGGFNAKHNDTALVGERDDSR